MTTKPPQLCECTSCPLRGRVVVLPRTNPSAKMIIIGEAPGYSEELRGEPFVGASGSAVDRQLTRWGMHRAQCHITNAVLCRPAHSLSAAQWKTALACCRPRLEKELSKCPAKVVLALGGQALTAMTGKRGIFNWAGAPLASMMGTRTVYGTLHPAYCLRKEGRNYLPIFATHTHRACRHALGRPQRWRWPRLVTEPGATALAVLRRLRSDGLPVAVDTETQGIDPLTAKIMCIGIGNIHRVVSLAWDDYNAGKFGLVKGVDDGHKRAVRDLLCDEKIPKTFHNAQHDILALQAHSISVAGFEGDTILGHAVIAPGVRHDLGFAASMEFNCSRWKSEFHASTDSKGEDAFVKRDPTELRRYNCRDVVATARLYHRQCAQIKGVHNGPALLAQYVDLTRITIPMRAHGVFVRQDRMAYYRGMLDGRKARARMEIRQLVRTVGYKPAPSAANPDGIFKPSAAHHVRGLFQHLGASSGRLSNKTGLPSFDDEALTNLLGHPKEAVAVAARTILRYRRWSKLLSTYIDGLPVDNNGYTHSSWKVWGTVTRRWASAQPNLENIPQKRERPSKVDPKNKRVTVAPGLRELFAADPGDWFIKGDKSQFELRMVALQARDAKLLALYERNADVHTANAYDLFGTQNPTKADRTLAKRFVYACVPMDTQALTREGWKTYSQLRVGEEILTYNAKKNRKEWAPIERLTYHKRAEMWEMRTSNSFCVRTTPDHRWFVHQRTWTEHSYTRPYMPPVSIRTTAEINQNSNIIVNAPMHPDMQSLVIEDPLALSKYRGDWSKLVCQMSSRERRAFLAGFLIADGHQKDRHLGQTWFWSQNKGNLAEAALTAAAIEHDGALWTTDRRNTKNPMWQGVLSKRQHVTGQKLKKRRLNDQPAWCPTTRNGSWVMRQGTCITITGNCNYGAEPVTIWRNLLVDFPWLQLSDVVRLKERWFGAHPDLVRWQQRILRKARECGYVEEPLSGWREHFIGSPDPCIVYNFPIQSGAAHIINNEGIALAKTIDWRTEYLLIQCHDEWCLGARDPMKTLPKLRKYMTTTAELDGISMTFSVDVALGHNWGRTIEVKKDSDVAAAMQTIIKEEKANAAS
jgi:uracil-DNA glycosylase family 4